MRFECIFLLPIVALAIPRNSQVLLTSETRDTPLLHLLYGDVVDTLQYKIHPSEQKEGATVNPNHLHLSKDYLSAQRISQIRGATKFPDPNDTRDIIDTQGMLGGIITFAHLPHFNCFDPDLEDRKIDIAILGAPFDTGTLYRPGARFGPDALRSAARRIDGSQFLDPAHELAIVDCADVNMTPFDNRIALNQLYRGQLAVKRHPTSPQASSMGPKVLTLGGDHTVALMAIRATYEQLKKPLHVIHFDSHIDTWDPSRLGGGLSKYLDLNHGTFLHFAHEQGYLAEENWHVGLRAPYIDPDLDIDHDAACGFKQITAAALDTIGVKGIVKKLRSLPKNEPVYISVDIDVLDPAFAPGTGTMEAGGLTSRELLAILNGLEGLNVVGADVVEVSPPYDNNAGTTTLVGTAVAEVLIRLMANV